MAELDIKCTHEYSPFADAHIYQAELIDEQDRHVYCRQLTHHAPALADREREEVYKLLRKWIKRAFKANAAAQIEEELSE